MRAKLRRKFIVASMLALLAVLVAVLGSINLANYLRMRQETDALLTALSENQGSFPQLEPPENRGPLPPDERFRPLRGWNAETPYETRYFSALTDGAGRVTRINTGHIAAVSPEQARAYVEQLAASGRTEGSVDGYRYRVTALEDGRLYVFLDCGRQREAVVSFFHNCCAISAAGLLVVFLLLWALSGWVIRPFIESVERQKRFVTDAGHEIKTPLAVIAANSEVIELTQGKSEWTDSIRGQVERLSRLVERMLTLTRSEEGELQLARARLDFSRLAADTLAAFAPLAARRDVHVETELEEGVFCFGDRDRLGELLGILADNAVKYVTPGGEIRYTLHAAARTLTFCAFNTCPAPACPPERLFDRFYREDSSRSEQGRGYGLGLSIARALAEAHGGTLDAAWAATGLLFTLRLPREVS